MTNPRITQFDRLIRRDPARRGLIGSAQNDSLCLGHLAQAAADLAANATSVAIVTGFYIPHGQPPAAETDGPPGTFVLALALRALNISCRVITDPACFPAVAAAAGASGFPVDQLELCPHATSSWLESFFSRGFGSTLSHLIAVERVGPSHTPESLAAQCRTSAAPLEEFLARVPPAAQGRCHNMHGHPIDPYAADLHRLFDEVHARHPNVKTIGIGDGGNEIGMGSIPWEDLCSRLDGPHAPWVPCRIATHWTVIAGTSNWGAYALAAAVVLLRAATDALRAWGREHQRHVLETMVREGPAIDGVTGRQEPTVDGLPFLTYIQPWEGILRLLELD